MLYFLSFIGALRPQIQGLLGTETRRAGGGGGGGVMEVGEEEDYIVLYMFVLRCTGPGVQNTL